MAILLTGKTVILQAPQGRQHVVSQLRPGDMLGEISLIGGKTRFASCVTAAPSDFAVLTTDRLKQMLDDQPRMGHQFLLMLRGLTTLCASALPPPSHGPGRLTNRPSRRGTHKRTPLVVHNGFANRGQSDAR
jgi:hypothetical protein